MVVECLFILNRNAANAIVVYKYCISTTNALLALLIGPIQGAVRTVLTQQAHNSRNEGSLQPTITNAANADGHIQLGVWKCAKSLLRTYYDGIRGWTQIPN